MASNFVKSLAALAFAAIMAAPLAAQELPADLSELSEAKLRKALMIEPLGVGSSMSQTFFRGAPGTSSGSPTAFGAAWRDGFVGGGYQQVRGGGQSDGSIATGFGLGNAKEKIGLEVVVASLSTFRSGLFDRTAFSFKAHRMVSRSAAVAVGVEDAIVAGGGTTDGATTVFVAASRVFSMRNRRFKQLTLSGGIGNGRFRFEKDALADKKAVNIFASAGLLVHEQASVIADWTGQDLAVGISLVPIQKFPIIISPTINDITGQNGNSARFSLGFGIGMRF